MLCRGLFYAHASTNLFSKLLLSCSVWRNETLDADASLALATCSKADVDCLLGILAECFLELSPDVLECLLEISAECFEGLLELPADALDNFLEFTPLWLVRLMMELLAL